MPLELNRVKMRSFVVAIALCFVTSPTFAWNSFGHRCVAEIARQQLEAPTRQQIVDTLRRHPRFVEDFAGKMPDDIAKADQATQDRWIFLQAATWPDTCDRIHLNPGEKKTVHFTLKPENLALYDQAGKWTVEPGSFSVMVGASSTDIRLRGQFEIVAQPKNASNTAVGAAASAGAE